MDLQKNHFLHSLVFLFCSFKVYLEHLENIFTCKFVLVLFYNLYDYNQNTKKKLYFILEDTRNIGMVKNNYFILEDTRNIGI